MRRTHLRRHDNILKRRLVHAGAFHLGLVMRQICGVGKPRRLQEARAAACALLACPYQAIRDVLSLDSGRWPPFSAFVPNREIALTTTVRNR